jgi:hypothetical protein
MKILYFLSGLCLFACKTTIAQVNGEEKVKFKISNIDSVKSVYIIYATRNDSTIKIVSKKENVNKCIVISKGNSYQLDVESLLKYSAGKRHIGGVKYNGVLIKLEGGNVIWDLFISENLNGLCYTSQTSSDSDKTNEVNN